MPMFCNHLCKQYKWESVGFSILHKINNFLMTVLVCIELYIMVHCMQLRKMIMCLLSSLMEIK